MTFGYTLLKNVGNSKSPLVIQLLRATTRGLLLNYAY